MSQPPLRVIEMQQILECVRMRDALPVVRAAYSALARGEVELPGVIGMRIPHTDAELHVKGAYVHSNPYFSLKMSGVFPHKQSLGLPTLSGSVFVFDAASGDLAAILRDGGYLTELRTAAAGALAADLLARPTISNVAVLGTSTQARFQIEALLLVRRPARVTVYGRTPHKAATCAQDIAAAHGLEVRVASTVQEAVCDADLIITATAAREPLVNADWVRPGTHVTAMGSDMPGKQELDPRLLGRAKVVVDRYDQCATQGELQHALAAGILAPGAVHGELGDVVLGSKAGRTSAEEITIADFTGVGALDAAMANLVLARLSS